MYVIKINGDIGNNGQTAVNANLLSPEDSETLIGPNEKGLITLVDVGSAVRDALRGNDIDQPKKRRKTKGISKKAKVDVEGYDPSSGEVLGPEGDLPVKSGSSVVVNEIESDQQIHQAWFTTKEDKSVLNDKGIAWKQGTWSVDEVSLLNSNIMEYCQQRGIEDPADIIFNMPKEDRKDFYRVASAGLQRPLFAVYRRIIRMYDAKNHIGKYTTEEVERLRELLEEYGANWAAIGNAMGRSAQSVKDRCRLFKEDVQAGKWKEEEEEKLITAVHEVCATSMGTSVTSNIPWAAVAELVKTRTEKQCRIKWLNALNWKQAGGKTGWSHKDDVMLVSRIETSGCQDEASLDWSILANGWPAVRSPTWLRSKWWNLKRTVNNYQCLTLDEVVKRLMNGPLWGKGCKSDKVDTTKNAAVRGSRVAKHQAVNYNQATGNDFWGVGEDSNSAASNSDVPVGHESLMALDDPTASLRPPLQLATDFTSQHFLVDVGDNLQLPSLPLPPLPTIPPLSTISTSMPTLSDSPVNGLITQESNDSRDVLLSRCSLSPLLSASVIKGVALTNPLISATTSISSLTSNLVTSAVTLQSVPSAANGGGTTLRMTGNSSPKLVWNPRTQTFSKNLLLDAVLLNKDSKSLDGKCADHKHSTLTSSSAGPCVVDKETEIGQMFYQTDFGEVSQKTPVFEERNSTNPLSKHTETFTKAKILTDSSSSLQKESMKSIPNSNHVLESSIDFAPLEDPMLFVKNDGKIIEQGGTETITASVDNDTNQPDEDTYMLTNNGQLIPFSSNLKQMVIQRKQNEPEITGALTTGGSQGQLSTKTNALDDVVSNSDQQIVVEIEDGFTVMNYAGPDSTQLLF